MTGVKVEPGQAGLPSVDGGTTSFWHREPSAALLGHRTTKEVPHASDVVVVGSGITGAFAARALVRAGRGVVMLEAREACWGATGRNGGHCQPGVWNSTPAVARFELATFNMLDRLVAENRIPCDWRVVGGVHPLFTRAEVDAARRRMKKLQGHPDLRDKAVLVLADKEEEKMARLRVPGALGVVYQPVAAKCWPYKLVAWVLEELLQSSRESDVGGVGDSETQTDIRRQEPQQRRRRGRFNLQTGTPALHLQRSGSSWIVHTSRGQIAARHVVLATNGYATNLMPRMTGLIVPVRGQVCALRPPRDAVALGHSYAWLSGPSDDYLIQRDEEEEEEADQGAEAGRGSEVGRRQKEEIRGTEEKTETERRKKGGELILGGERFSVPDGQEGISRDDEVDPVIGRDLRRAMARAFKLRPGDEREEPVLEAEYEWTGIMGYSRDSFPWVGRVPTRLVGDHLVRSVPATATATANDGQDDDDDEEEEEVYADGLWISAGYTGHGMPVAARCGVAVANMILAQDGDGVVNGEEDGEEEVLLPREFLVTHGRAEVARLMELPRTLEVRLRMLDDIG